MPIAEEEPVDVGLLDAGELGEALVRTRSAGWGEQAAVGLICDTWWWLRRGEFCQAVEAVDLGDGAVAAWVDWGRVDPDVAASASEYRVLHLARSLAGTASPEALSALLSGFDDDTLTYVLRALFVAVRGRSAAITSLCECGRRSAW